ncbi:hypothetical protein, partial [Enterobacter hormaechei]|uniref:hypothetical protein n=1 Tax=Enterobacter hormaechei TaxID=158836 RepID=UPI00197A7DBD
RKEPLFLHEMNYPQAALFELDKFSIFYHLTRVTQSMSELDWTMKISQSYTASCYPCRGQLIVAHNLAVRGTVVLIHLAFSNCSLWRCI